jgi:hypothetical protein
LLVAQFGAQFHPIVVIFAALRKQGVKGAEELREQVLAVMHSRREALIEIARRGVERAVQGPPIAVQDISCFSSDTAIDVDGLEPALRRQFQS